MWRLKLPANQQTKSNISTAFMAVKTNRPIPKPKGMVIPGAVNFSGASMKEIPIIIPSHIAGTRIRAATAQVAAREATKVVDVLILSRLRRNFSLADQ